MLDEKPCSERSQGRVAKVSHRETRDYKASARAIVRALKNVNWKGRLTDARICLLILDRSYLAGRDAAIFTRQRQFSALLCVTKGQVSKSLSRLFNDRVFLPRLDGVYQFNLISNWKLPERGTEPSRARRDQLELEFDKLERQLAFEFNELDAELKEQFLRGEISQQETSVSQQEIRKVSEQETSVSHDETSASHHTYVGSTSTFSERVTFDAESTRIWKQAMDFFREDSRVRIKEELKKNTWRVAATIKEWPQPLEQVIATCKDAERTGYPTTKNRAARVFDALKEKLGEKWLDHFPNTKANLTFED
jgi:hypothetical protein